MKLTDTEASSKKRICGLGPVELREIFPSPESSEHPTIGIVQRTYKYALTSKPGVRYARPRR